MKRSLAPYLLLTCAMILCGCTSNPGTMVSNDNRNGRLFLVEGEEVCQEVTTNKMWQFSKGGPFSSLEEEKRYVVELNFGGYDDWRLPTKSELFDLYVVSDISFSTHSYVYLPVIT